MFSFADLSHLELMHAESLTCVRRTGELGDGCVVVGGLRVRREMDEHFQICASVQPMGGRDMQRMPEGDYITEGLTIWQGREGQGPMLGVNDHVLRDGKTYQVRTANDWGAYVQCMASFVSQGADR